MKNHRILLVDDQLDHLRIMVSIIESHLPNYTIYQAKSGEDALHVLEKSIPDIIISDWEMPSTDGLELAKNIKQSPTTENIPIIIVSGINITANHLKKAFEAGAVDFLRKPINPVEMLARINAAIIIANKNKKLITEREQKILENVLLSSELKSTLLKIQNHLAALNEICREQQIRTEIEPLSLLVSKKLKGLQWKKYAKAYSNIYPDFTRRLLMTHKSLTPTELELCQMLRLGLSNKEISDFMSVSPDSLRVSRSRLRKKLNLATADNLQTYLASI